MSSSHNEVDPTSPTADQPATEPVEQKEVAKPQKTATEGAASYGADKITVLAGLEAVRKRPAMYIGDTGVRGLHHCVYEVVDNSIDEALAGFCHHVHVAMNADGSISVNDDGRGIPVEMHKTEKRSALEVVMTVLHAGGKFDHESYKVSGGLHGVGVSCVNALSEWMEVEVRRDARCIHQRYERGNPVTPVEKIGKCKGTGTKVTFYPDKEIFNTIEYNWDTLSNRLRELAFLNRGLEIKLHPGGAGARGAVSLQGRHLRVHRAPEQATSSRCTPRWSRWRARRTAWWWRSRCSMRTPTATPSSPTSTTSTRWRAAPT
jgi:hypothetical protein